MEEKKLVRSFYDLEVYQTAYKTSLDVLIKVVPKLPKEEQFDLSSQLRRSAKAVPRLIAESYSKRHQRKGFQALIDDAMQESNETIVSLSHAKDIYKIEPKLCEELIVLYDRISRQLYRLSLAWSSFKERQLTQPTHPIHT